MLDFQNYFWLICALLPRAAYCALFAPTKTSLLTPTSESRPAFPTQHHTPELCLQLFGVTVAFTAEACKLNDSACIFSTVAFRATSETYSTTACYDAAAAPAACFNKARTGNNAASTATAQLQLPPQSPKKQEIYFSTFWTSSSILLSGGAEQDVRFYLLRFPTTLLPPGVTQFMVVLSEHICLFSSSARSSVF